MDLGCFLNPVFPDGPAGRRADALLEAALAEAGFSLADVEIVLLTHQDPDHAAGLVPVLERTDATVMAHEAEVPYVDGSRELLKRETAPRFRSYYEDRYEGAPVDVELVGGESIRTAGGPLEVIHTPGHCPGHVSAYLPAERMLIAGDAISSEGALGGPRPGFTPDMDEAIESVGRLAELDVAQLLCYHGGFTESTSQDVRDCYERLRAEYEG